MENDIQMWLLVLTLIFPRLGLIIAWFSNQIPFNTIPFVGDFLMAVFIPRFLMVIYIATNLGTGNVWFWLHLVFAILSFLAHGARTAKVIQEGKDPYDFRSYISK